MRSLLAGLAVPAALAGSAPLHSRAVRPAPGPSHCEPVLMAGGLGRAEDFAPRGTSIANTDPRFDAWF